MPHEPLDEVTRQHMRALIQANFAGRDDLYAAADAIDSATLSMICRKLAEDLADNAIELQQIALAAGLRSADVNELGTQLQAELMERLHQRGADQAILEEAQECERLVREEYDGAIKKADNASLEDILRRQRQKVVFGEQVVKQVRSSSEGVSP